MSESTVLREHLTTQLQATVARRSYEEILYSVPPAACGVQPEGYSLWQSLEHTCICQADYYCFCTDPDYPVPTRPAHYWPDAVVPSSVDAWNHSLSAFRRDLQSVKDLANDASLDIAVEIPHAVEKVRKREGGASYYGSTYAEEIAAIADHNASHLGQFVTVRRLLGVWPSGTVEPPA